VDMDQIDLYKHLPIPFELGNLLITLESGWNVIASNDTSAFGLELTHDNLLHCQVGNVHSGNIYICPALVHSSLVKRMPLLSTENTTLNRHRRSRNLWCRLDWKLLVE
jgi:hypothetical protein